MVPRLSARREDVHCWSMPARVVQAGRIDDEHRVRGLRCHDRSAAFCAETPAGAVTSVCRGDVILWSALRKSERACGNEYPRSVSRSASSLTVAAMAIESHDRLGGTLVSHCSAGAATDERDFHDATSLAGQPTVRRPQTIRTLGLPSILRSAPGESSPRSGTSPS